MEWQDFYMQFYNFNINMTTFNKKFSELTSNKYQWNLQEWSLKEEFLNTNRLQKIRSICQMVKINYLKILDWFSHSIKKNILAEHMGLEVISTSY